MYPEHRAMTLPLPRAKRKEHFDSDPDFEAENIFTPLAFSFLAAFRGSRCLSAAGERRILRETHGADLSFCKRLLFQNVISTQKVES